MTVEPPRPAIAAPSFPAFVVAYATGVTALVISGLWGLITGADRDTKKGVLFFALVPVLVLISSPWVGRSSSLGMLVRRSVAAHALAPIVPAILMAVSQSSDPGASGHGGIAMVFIFVIPYASAVTSAIGLVSAFVASGVMHLLRARGPGSGAPLL